MKPSEDIIELLRSIGFEHADTFDENMGAELLPKYNANFITELIPFNKKVGIFAVHKEIEVDPKIKKIPDEAIIHYVEEKNIVDAMGMMLAFFLTE